MICPRCNKPMNNTMHFEQGRKFQFKECPKCHDKTKPKRLHFEDILSDKLNEIKQNRK